MSIPDYKKKEANVKQFEAAKDNNKKVMLIAGPDTGKSYTIAKRVAYLLLNGINPNNIYVISFTRATCTDLTNLILRASQPGCFFLHSIIFSSVSLSILIEQFVFLRGSSINPSSLFL